jgi:hypothetical protein
MDGARFSQAASIGEEGACRHIFQRRERRTIRFSCWNDLGHTRQDPGRCAYRQTVSSQHAIGYLGQGGIAVHDLAQAHFGAAVHRIPAATDHELSAEDISRCGWLAGAQSQVGAALFSRCERPHQTILPAAIFA